MDFAQIRYIITTRPGVIYGRFKEYLALTRLTEYCLPKMSFLDIKSLARMHGVGLSDETARKVHAISEGNPLYLSEILSLIRKDPKCDLEGLPGSVTAFFKRDLIRRYDASENEILRDALAVMTVLTSAPTAWQLGEVCGHTKREMKKKVLYRLSSYIMLSGEDTYSFFHQKFVESLRYGQDPILEEEDILSAHRKVIDWCEPLEKWEESDPRCVYGLDNLPHHYWQLGQKDRHNGFKGFRGLLGRNNLRCEIACRIFLRNMISERSPQALMQDEPFFKCFKKLFLESNDAGRHALLRLNSDLGGFGLVPWTRASFGTVSSPIIHLVAIGMRRFFG